jgi:hypothetical protein
MSGLAREPANPVPNPSGAMAAVAAESSDEDDDSDREIALTVSMTGHRGSLGMTADTVGPAGASKLKFKRPLSRSIVEIELYHSSNGHIGSNMLIRPKSLSPEPHGWRVVECQARAGGCSPPFTNVQCYGVSQQADAHAQHFASAAPAMSPGTTAGEAPALQLQTSPLAGGIRFSGVAGEH